MTVTNTGTGDLTLSGITLGGANASDFAIAASGTTCATATPIVPDGTCDVAVNFTAPATDTREATLTIASDDPDTPSVVVGLIGRGSDFTFDVQAGGSTSAIVSAGQTATYNLTILGTTGVTGTATLTCTESITDATCSISPASAILSATTPANFVVSLVTTARTTTAWMPMPPNSNPRGPETLPMQWVWALALALMLGTMAASRRRARLVLPASMLFVLLWSACSSEPVPQQRGTPAGDYTLTITATVGSVSKTQNLAVRVN